MSCCTTITNGTIQKKFIDSYPENGNPNCLLKVSYAEEAANDFIQTWSLSFEVAPRFRRTKYIENRSSRVSTQNVPQHRSEHTRYKNGHIRNCSTVEHRDILVIPGRPIILSGNPRCWIASVQRCKSTRESFNSHDGLT